MEAPVVWTVTECERCGVPMAISPQWPDGDPIVCDPCEAAAEAQRP